MLVLVMRVVPQCGEGTGWSPARPVIDNRRCGMLIDWLAGGGGLSLVTGGGCQQAFRSLQTNFINYCFTA